MLLGSHTTQEGISNLCIGCVGLSFYFANLVSLAQNIGILGGAFLVLYQIAGIIIRKIKLYKQNKK